MKSDRKTSLCLLLLIFCLGASGCTRPFPEGRPRIETAPGASPASTQTEPPRGTGITPRAPAAVTPTAVTPTAVTLRSLAEARGLQVGAAVDLWPLANDSDYVEILSSQFNALVTENALKWERIHPERERYNFEGGDALVAFARANNMQVNGHVLVWDNQLPAWLLEGQFTREEWLEILRQHIYTVVGHFRGQIGSWDVVNEAFDTDGSLRNTIWMRHIGPQYIALAFRWAHEADPDAILIYNDAGGEGLNRKSDAIFALAQGLLRMGAPLHGVGLQMHVWSGSPPAQDELQANMQRLADLGLKVYITEMDVRTQYSQADEATKQKEQAQVYRQALSACLQVKACQGFYTWGVLDRYTWITDYTNHADAPLLFDKDGLPKPAYEALIDVLKAGP